MRLVVDAGAAADPDDPFCDTSRSFPRAVVALRLPLLLPTLTRVEVACTLSRRLRDPGAARRLVDGLLAGPTIHEYPLDGPLAEEAVTLGTGCHLRGADTVYAALARWLDATLVSWDGEHLQRAGGQTPEHWLAAQRPCG